MSGPISNRVQVQKYRVSNQAVSVDTNATQGAQFGINIWDPSGNLVAWPLATSTPSTGESNFDGTTDDVDEGQFNLYFTDLRAQNAVGAILENSANVTLTYVTGTSIEANLTTVTPSSGGTLQATLFDSFGRIEKTQAITWATAGSVALTYTAGTNTVAASLNNTAVTAGLYGDSTHVATFTVNAQGQLTNAGSTAIAFPAAPVTSVFGRTGAVVAQSGDYTFAQIGSTPTTLAGYGITNGVTNTTQVIAGTGLSGGGALSGNVSLSLASQAASTLLGVSSTGAGTPTAITLGANLSMSASGVLSASGGGGSGTVTSVALTAPGIFAVGGSPITTSGTISITLATQSANLVWAGPSSGSAATPTFRSLVAADIPSLPYAPAFTNQSANLVFAGPASGSAAAPGFRSLVAADIPALSYVTSVNVAAPTQFSVTGGPVTGSGTLTIAWNNQTANTFLAGPASGSSAAPTFRSPVLADIGVALPNGYIDGCIMSWNSATSISVSIGNCYLPNGSFLSITSALTLSGLSLTASTIYHVYAYNNSGAPAIECVTTAPASPYSGTARAKTGDTSRRYIGSVLSNSSGQVYSFVHSNDQINYRTAIGTAPFPALTNGRATAATNVSLAATVPVTACQALLFLYNDPTTTVTALYAASDGASVPSGYEGFVASGAQVSGSIRLDSNQAFSYAYSSTPAGSAGFTVRVSGYVFQR